MLVEENVRRAACLINGFSLQRRHPDVNGCSCGSLPFGPPALCAVFFPRGKLQWGASVIGPYRSNSWIVSMSEPIR